MINHGRTLLLNRDGGSRPSADYYLEEYVPADFESVSLPSSLRKFYKDVIGNDSDDAYANYIVWILLRAIHATEHASLLTDLDPRITYLHDQDVQDYGLRVSSEPEGSTVYPNNVFIQTAKRQKLYHRWLLTVSNPFIQINSMTGEGIIQQEFDGADGLSDDVVLSEADGLSVKLSPWPFPDGSAWDLEAVIKPQVGLTDLLSTMELLGPRVEEDILGGSEEPYVTLSKLWKKHILIHYRLAGYVLAYIYRVEEARLNGE